MFSSYKLWNRWVCETETTVWPAEAVEFHVSICPAGKRRRMRMTRNRCCTRIGPNETKCLWIILFDQHDTMQLWRGSLNWYQFWSGVEEIWLFLSSFSQWRNLLSMTLWVLETRFFICFQWSYPWGLGRPPCADGAEKVWNLELDLLDILYVYFICHICLTSDFLEHLLKFVEPLLNPMDMFPMWGIPLQGKGYSTGFRHVSTKEWMISYRILKNSVLLNVYLNKIDFSSGSNLLQVSNDCDLRDHMTSTSHDFDRDIGSKLSFNAPCVRAMVGRQGKFFAWRAVWGVIIIQNDGTFRKPLGKNPGVKCEMLLVKCTVSHFSFIIIHYFGWFLTLCFWQGSAWRVNRAVPPWKWFFFVSPEAAIHKKMNGYGWTTWGIVLVLALVLATFKVSIIKLFCQLFLQNHVQVVTQ